MSSFPAGLPTHQIDGRGEPGGRPICSAVKPGRSSCVSCASRSLTICRVLESHQLAEVESAATVARLDAGATLFEQGDDARHVYNVTAGTIRLSRTLADGRRQITGFMLPGDFIGLSVRMVHAYSAEAIGPCQVCRFTASQMRDLMEHLPRLEHELFDRARDELDAAQDQMLLLGRKSPMEKVASFLLDLAHRCERWGDHADRVRLDMTRTDIADYLGLTIETVSRTLSQFARDGLIRLPAANRWIELCNLQALRQLNV